MDPEERYRTPRHLWALLAASALLRAKADSRTAHCDELCDHRSEMNHVDTTRLQLEPHRIKLSAPEAAGVIVATGVDDLANSIFRHDPPTPAELEQAIDIVEDALMADGVWFVCRTHFANIGPRLRGHRGENDGRNRAHAQSAC